MQLLRTSSLAHLLFRVLPASVTALAALFGAGLGSADVKGSTTRRRLLRSVDGAEVAEKSIGYRIRNPPRQGRPT